MFRLSYASHHKGAAPGCKQQLLMDRIGEQSFLTGKQVIMMKLGRLSKRVDDFDCVSISDPCILANIAPGELG